MCLTKLVEFQIDGCADIDVAFKMGKTRISSWGYSMAVHASVTEAATGVTLNGTKDVKMSYVQIKLDFAKQSVFKPGFKFTSKVLFRFKVSISFEQQIPNILHFYLL